MAAASWARWRSRATARSSRRSVPERRRLAGTPSDRRIRREDAARQRLVHELDRRPSAPLIFRNNDTDVVAAATRDGRVMLLDATSLGGTNHATPSYASQPFTPQARFAPEALAMWRCRRSSTPAPRRGCRLGRSAADRGATPSAAATMPPARMALVRRRRARATPRAAHGRTDHQRRDRRAQDRGQRRQAVMQPGWVSAT